MSAPTRKMTLVNNNHRRKDNFAQSTSKLRQLILDLINEVDSLDRSALSITDVLFTKNCESIRFYEEVKRFEITLIKAALKRSNGHQVHAAKLLNLNPSTLNSKIKQYDLRHLVV
jgi:transcriptional regulator with GAF, ATPase, and Fis domain